MYLHPSSEYVAKKLAILGSVSSKDKRWVVSFRVKYLMLGSINLRFYCIFKAMPEPVDF